MTKQLPIESGEKPTFAFFTACELAEHINGRPFIVKPKTYKIKAHGQNGLEVELCFTVREEGRIVQINTFFVWVEPSTTCRFSFEVVVQYAEGPDRRRSFQEDEGWANTREVKYEGFGRQLAIGPKIDQMDEIPSVPS